MKLKEFELVKIEEIIRKNLPKFRWWPREALSINKVHIDYSKLINNKYIVTFLRHNDYLFYVPWLSIDKKDERLGDRCIKLNNMYLYEAEFFPEYFNLLEYEDYTYKEYNKLIGRSVYAEPLTLESTNIVAKHVFDNNVEVVVKSYRLLPRVNYEPLVIAKLAEEGYRHIPLLYRIYSFKGQTVTLITQYVYGDGDGGYPFYTTYINALKTRSMRSRNAYRLGLASKLGTIIGEMHILLNRKRDNRFFGLEEISNEDVSRWSRRVKKRFNEILRIFDKIIESSENKEYYEFWKNVFLKSQNLVDNVEYMFSVFENACKARIHQDLHLGQMIYISKTNDFIITDFEGEPGRTDEERIEKEPPIRDIATMVRSFQYLAFMAYLEVRGKNIDIVARKLLKNDVTWEWRMRHSLSMLLSYIASTSNPNIHCFKNKMMLIEHYNNVLMPWLIERALYEIMYELMYRPEWVAVPIVGLLNPAIPINIA
ncbi:MAG: hypothetical protein J7L82_07160 [Staphylothermus sp.]|nr:hypothetical protein [Staphylothermus sp.]